MAEFIRANQECVQNNNALLQTVATPAKARVYLDAHLK